MTSSENSPPKRTKETHPRLAHRLPREHHYLFDDVEGDENAGITLMDRAQKILGDRMGESKKGYTLDGKVANCDKLVEAAGLAFKDES